MTWFFPGASFFSKLLCSFLLLLIVLQYMFGTVGNFRRWDNLFYTNTTRVQYNKHPFMSILLNTTSTPENAEFNTTYSPLNMTFETLIPQLCPVIPPHLSGRQEIIKSVPSILDLEKKFNWLLPGGQSAPANCSPRYHVAIIVPYRSRAQHLLLFLQHMHPFLRKQQIFYTIYIIEQDGGDPFNRAMLMNVGFSEALKLHPFDCFIFHDVDLLPEDDRNLYTCPEQPRHMSVAVDVFKYKLPYAGIFGGVSALTRQQFQDINGFSNSFWGWGGEDDDMSNRIRFHNYHISRYPVNIARYTMLTHQKEKANPKRYENLQQGKKKYNSDGLVNLKYNVVERRATLLYTWLLVNLKKPS